MTRSMSGSMRSTAARPSAIASLARWYSIGPKSGSSGVISTSAGSPARRLRATRCSTMSSAVLNTSKMDGIDGSSPGRRTPPSQPLARRPIQLGSSLAFATGARPRAVGTELAPAQVDGDYEVGAKRAAHRHRHGIHQPAVDQQCAVMHHRREEPRQCARGAHDVEQLAAAQPDLAPGVELRRDRAERRRELADLEILEGGAKQVEETVAADQPALQAEIHEAPDLAPHEARDPLLELVELPGGVHRADQRADRRAADQIDLDAAFLQRADGADVRPAAGAARAERESDSRLARQGAREFTRAVLIRDATPAARRARRSQRSPGRRRCTW